MKHAWLVMALLFASGVALAQTPLSTEYQQSEIKSGNVSYTLTRYALPGSDLTFGLPLQGVLLALRTSRPETLTFRIAITGRTADGKRLDANFSVSRQMDQPFTFAFAGLSFSTIAVVSTVAVAED